MTNDQGDAPPKSADLTGSTSTSSIRTELRLGHRDPQRTSLGGGGPIRVAARSGDAAPGHEAVQHTLAPSGPTSLGRFRGRPVHGYKLATHDVDRLSSRSVVAAAFQRPRANTTTAKVRMRILMSSQSDQFSM